MIVEFFLNLFLGLLRTVLTPAEVTHIPATFATVLSTIIAYLIDGIRVVNAFIDETYIGALLAFVVFVDGVVLAYRLLMWALKKIPFVSIQ